MTEEAGSPDRAGRIVYLAEWAARNHGTLQLSGTVGFGRDCVGILGSSDHYIDTADVKDRFAYKLPYEWWEPEDAYHKHDCLAVLGHGDGPLCQLYDWVRWLDEHGFGAEDNYRQPKDHIDLAFHGISLTRIVKLGECDCGAGNLIGQVGGDHEKGCPARGEGDD